MSILDLQAHSKDSRYSLDSVVESASTKLLVKPHFPKYVQDDVLCYPEQAFVTDNFEVESQKLQAKTLLDGLQRVFGYAVLAGGAVRDWVGSEQARDLDIFVHVKGSKSDAYEKRKKRVLDKLAEVFTAEEMSTIKCLTDTMLDDYDPSRHSFLDYTENADIDLVFELVSKGIPVQIITLNTKELNLDRFCYNMSQAMFDGYNIAFTPMFRFGFGTNTFIQTSVKPIPTAYREKMQARFPDASFIEFALAESKTDTVFAAQVTADYTQFRIQFRDAALSPEAAEVVAVQKAQGRKELERFGCYRDQEDVQLPS